MLVIREAQMEVLRRSARQQFQDRLLKHLQTVLCELPASVVIDGEGIVNSAVSLGITRERDVARFGELIYTYVRTHDPAALSKRAQNILLDYGVEPAVSLDRRVAWRASAPDVGVDNG